MSCVVEWCKNRSDQKKNISGISFHRFPNKNEVWREDWIQIIRNCNGDNDWIPNKYSVICSKHFEANDLYTTKGGLRRVVTYALPITDMIKNTEYQVMETESQVRMKPECTPSKECQEDRRIPTCNTERSYKKQANSKSNSRTEGSLQTNIPNQDTQDPPTKKCKSHDVPPLCCCCLEREPVKPLWPKGKSKEDYGRMLYDCFRLDLSSLTNASLCSICVSQLQAAERFRSQASSCTTRLLNNTNRPAEDMRDDNKEARVLSDGGDSDSKPCAHATVTVKMERVYVEEFDVTRASSQDAKGNSIVSGSGSSVTALVNSSNDVPLKTEVFIEEAVSVKSEPSDSDDEPLRVPEPPWRPSERKETAFKTAQVMSPETSIPSGVTVKLEPMEDDDTGQGRNVTSSPTISLSRHRPETSYSRVDD